MKKRLSTFFNYYLTIFFIFTFFWLHAQGIVKEDLKAREFVTLGKKAFENEEYNSAIDYFQKAYDRPFHNLSTAALFLQASAYQKSGQNQEAIKKYTKFINKFPKSNYIFHAKYHKAIALITENQNIRSALFLLQEVKSSQKNSKLALQAENAYNNFLYNTASVSLLENLYLTFQVEDKSDIVEALYLAYLNKKEFTKAKNLIEEYKKNQPEFSKGIENLHQKLRFQKDSVDKKVIRIAVILPFFSDQYNSKMKVIPANSDKALEFYQGIRMAADSFKFSRDVKVLIRAFDTEKDTNKVKKMLETGVKNYQPDVIIGAFYNDPSKIVADWAEKNKVITFIPFSPENYLIEDKKYVFLCKPSLKTHGTAIAKYAYHQLGARKPLVVEENSHIGQELAKAFIDYMKEKKANPIEKKISHNPDLFKVEFPKIITSVRNSGTDITFLASNSEGNCGIALNNCEQYYFITKFIGGPDWEYFDAIDQVAKEKFEIVFTNGVNIDKDSISNTGFIGDFIRTFSHYPSTFAMEGFDVMNYVLSTYEKFNGDYLKQIHNGSVVHGLIQSFYFREQNDNQYINIKKFDKKKILKVYEYK